MTNQSIQTLARKVRQILAVAAVGVCTASVVAMFATTSRADAHSLPDPMTTTPPTMAVAASRSAASKTDQKKSGRATKKQPRKLVGKVNLNTATAKELSMLPGIGESKAARVIQWRAKRGKFRRIIDLRRVKGFGRKSVKKLASYLTLSGETTLHWSSSPK